MKLLTIVGARPQFVKAAVVSRAIMASQRRGGNVSEIVLHTGQHYDANMSDVFFSEMNIPKPKYQLGIGGGRHGAMTGEMLAKIEEVILLEQPDVVLVYGDTNSTLAGALAAAKLHVPVAHVEAGLRSFNRRMPEEINRVVTDHVSTILFAPTATAVQNLCNEGVAAESIKQVGDVMFDAALYYRNAARAPSVVANLYGEDVGSFYLATVHRAENTDDEKRLGGIMRALDKIAETHPVLLPLHPRTRKLLGNWQPKNIKLIEPVGYFDMIALLQASRGVFTDSGGVQKEAFFFGRACLVLRDETEWVELVDAGFNALAGADSERIIDLAADFFDRPRNFSLPLYGNGRAGESIIELIQELQ